MQSFLIISKDKQKAKDYVLDFAKEKKISKFDIYTLQTEKALGIEDVKNLFSKIFLKPIKGDKKIVVVEAFLGATVEAQNAFLKVLEEPPFSTFIFLLASENYFLSTINSRTKLVQLDREIKFTEEDEKLCSEIVENLKSETIGYRLKLAQDMAGDKNEAILFLEKFIVFARNNMVKELSSEYKKKIDVLNKYYKKIKESNVNLRLALENLFLEL
ncbi:MAG: hypothetical protein A2798_02880 [Candidatus Levybacteria bacterium RIFCSPHIGHO2_01_FULL_37_17]|nr:MAG: hypothetical protein A2798_02880 [Candidatus Levybacteria bacterium RIFCSPHIGHO2_01_FULL_37_17]OGH36801.1 MAG: hypothetical protein A2959_00870 [Candidatus Levybacteria bacterium RIFCSPLOWO2_01_FULL_38_23]